MICPECKKSLTWENDMDSENVGHMEDGIISRWVCTECKIEVNKFIPVEDEK